MSLRRGGRGDVIPLPPHRPGMRIGLYGGTFDPPHAGHLHVAETALRRLRLDRVWWIVTPGNPLKARSPGDRPARLAAMRRVARHPRMVVTDIDGALGSRYTVDTVRFLRRRCPGVRFVWIMGADSLAGFHRWKEWRAIGRLLPLAAIDRPGWTMRALHAPAARLFAAERLRAAPSRLADAAPPAWLLLTGPRSSLSSTALRDQSEAVARPS